ncbi:head scaffolding protein [Ralstonia phage RSB3]|uniref:Putative scaffolding protein n=1 Tax=Ralstonia phage RSB3 TaxID=1402875 RepID=U3TIZ0_9CAUD|nr:head scaffolding protein [Ralstonia phage RSB3]BAN92346.1 putative scaffolding protein [Ralstonia phage RSB3]
MTMAEQVAIPAGVNPAAAIPSDATVHQRAAAPGAPGGEGGIPPLPPAASQKEGHAPSAPVTPPGASNAEFEAFKAWQAAQQAKNQPATPTPPAAKPETPAAHEGLGAQGAMDAVKAAGGADPYIASTFSMFEMVAPNVDLARAVGNAIDRADMSLVDKAYLREVAGDKADKLIAVAEGLVQHVNKAVENLVSDIHSSAGGEAQWNASTAAFNTNAPQYLKQFVVDQLNSANPDKIKAGVKAVLDFVKQSGAVPIAPQGHVRAGGGTPDASLGLSKQQYQEARLKLNRFDRNYNDQARELDARRALGKKLGM